VNKIRFYKQLPYLTDLNAFSYGDEFITEFQLVSALTPYGTTYDIPIFAPGARYWALWTACDTSRPTIWDWDYFPQGLGKHEKFVIREGSFSWPMGFDGGRSSLLHD